MLRDCVKRGVLTEGALKGCVKILYYERDINRVGYIPTYSVL